MGAHLLIPLLIFLLSSVRAEDPRVPGGAADAGRGSDPAGSTVGRCLRELENPDPEIRRSAALVLGKHSRDPRALQALLGCLGDRDAEIRQSALVSLTEGVLIPPVVKERIFPLFQDPDVHVRRIATSLLRNLARRGYGYGFGFGLPGPRGGGDRLLRLARRHANPALEDPDLSVRRNVLAGAARLPGLLDNARLYPFFAAPQDELVILALQAYGGNREAPEERARRLEPLVSHRNPEVRQLVALQLPALGAAARPLLLRLRRDPSPRVRSRAIRALLLTGAPEALREAPGFLDDRELPLDDRRLFVSLLRRYGAEALPALRALLRNDQPSLRAEAMRILAVLPDGGLESRELLQALEDEDQAVRRQAAALLQRRKHPLQPDELRRLVRSPHPDLRLAALRLPVAAGQDAALQEGVLELCLDDDLQVRRRALERLSSVRPEGWREILAASLDDESPEIQEAAARCLLPLRDPKARQALRDYYPRCRDDRLRRTLERELRIP